MLHLIECIWTEGRVWCIFPLNYPENDVWSIAVRTAQAGDDGWIIQPCCLLIKWLCLSCNLPIWISSASEPTDVLYRMYTLSLILFLSILSLLSASLPITMHIGALLPEMPGLQQVQYSEKPHKWSFISNTKHHQTGLLSPPVASKQTHLVLFWKWKVACDWNSRC